MKFIKNMKIGKKLISGFITMALIVGIVGIIGITNIRKIDKADRELYENMTVPISQMGDISTAFQRMRVNIRQMLLVTNPEEKKAEIDKIKERRTEISNLSQEFEKTILSKEMTEAFKTFKDANNKFSPLLDKAIDYALKDKNKEAVELISETGEAGIASRTLQDAIDKIVSMKVVDAKAKMESNTKAANTSSVVMVVVIVISILIAISFGFFLSYIISTPVKKLTLAANKLALGDVDVTIEDNTKDEIGDLMTAFSSMVDNIKTQSDIAQKISQGNLDMDIVPKSEKDILANSMKSVNETLKDLVSEASMLTKAAVEGRLSTRGNAAKFNGAYREIVKGVNDTLDSVIGPLNVAAEYVEKISKGNIPEKIKDNYNGDFNLIKNNLNTCIEAVNSMIKDADMLVNAAIEGRLNTRADAGKHNGDFRKIVEGVNKTLDAVILPVKEASEVLKEMSKGNLKVNVKGNYQGDHAEIKNALNDTINTIYSYVSEISSVLTEMAAGNMNVGINADYRGDFVEIKTSLNNIVDSFNQVLGDMNEAADQVSAGAGQVADGSQALSQGSTEQASSIEELTSAITQVAAQTKQNAVSANEANELAISAKDNAAQGNLQMKEMLKSMIEINDSSSNISKIIKVIDEIAFQTNILALNAAVEAARAGQHGKGFAVVAEEVRNLAARSANAAKETTALIEGSIKKVEAGTKIANETAVALNKIVEGVDKAANLVAEIAAASNEQATAIAQINNGIEQVSEVIQTNSATAEESAAASEELSSQAELLKGMVGRFVLKGEYERRNLRVKNQYSKNEEWQSQGKLEVAAGRVKPKISLNEREFGKY